MSVTRSHLSRYPEAFPIHHQPKETDTSYTVDLLPELAAYIVFLSGFLHINHPPEIHLLIFLDQDQVSLSARYF